jgi:hypothetical protein
MPDVPLVDALSLAIKVLRDSAGSRKKSSGLDHDGHVGSSACQRRRCDR